jgi:hypothetical protein
MVHAKVGKGVNWDGWGSDGAHGPCGHGIKTLCFRACITHALKHTLGHPQNIPCFDGMLFFRARHTDVGPHLKLAMFHTLGLRCSCVKTHTKLLQNK